MLFDHLEILTQFLLYNSLHLDQGCGSLEFLELELHIVDQRHLLIIYIRINVEPICLRPNPGTKNTTCTLDSVISHQRFVERGTEELVFAPSSILRLLDFSLPLLAFLILAQVS